MGLQITSTEEKKITINGSPIELDSIYVRLQYFALPNGTEMEIAFQTYYNKDAYLNEQPLPTNISPVNFKVGLNVDEEQSVVMAHEYAKKGFEEWGYNVTIL